MMAGSERASLRERLRTDGAARKRFVRAVLFEAFPLDMPEAMRPSLEDGLAWLDEVLSENPPRRLLIE